MATEVDPWLFSCLGVRIRELLSLAWGFSPPRPKTEPRGELAPQGSVLGVVDRFRTPSVLMAAGIAIGELGNRPA